MTREEAEKKLQESGLKLGKVMPEYNNKVPAGSVIRQNVSYKKRVFHDTAVDLAISDGPKPDYAADTNDTPDVTTPDTNTNADAGSGNSPNTGAAPDNTTGTPPDQPPPDIQTHTFDRTISIPHDHLGSRQVRIEYRNSQGWQPAPVDEAHNEGDKIPVRFTYLGKNITLRIYYDDRLSWERTFDPQDKKRIQ